MRTFFRERTASPLAVALGILLAAAMAGVAAQPAGAAAGEEAQPAEGLYVKKDSWAETMTATREALLEERARKETVEPIRSDVLRRGDAPLTIEADVSGARWLWLTVNPTDDGNGQDHGVWVEPVLAERGGKRVSLTQLEPVSATCGWNDLLVDRDYQGQPLSVAGEECESGLFAHAPSEVVYELGGRFERFEARVGVNDTAEDIASVSFEVGVQRDPVRMLWGLIVKDFPAETAAWAEDVPGNKVLEWFDGADDGEITSQAVEKVLAALQEAGVAGGERHAPPKGADTVARLNAYAQAAAARARLRDANRQLAEVDLDALRRAVEDLAETFPDAYANAGAFLARIERCINERATVRKRMADGDPDALEALTGLAGAMGALEREALTASPLVRQRPILYVHRAQYVPDHHNTATLFQTGEINTASFRGGAALRVVDVATGETRTLFETEEGMVRDPEVSFDGRRIVFSYRRNIDDDYHIYEINADGSSMRQLTGAPGVADIDPLYLPDGDIIFSSTREPKYCMCNRHIMANLFRMGPNGENIQQIGKSTLFEGHGSLLADGRILYDRWEYVDRNFGDAQALWTVNTDGTNHAVYYGNNTSAPGGVIDARPIPGSDRAVCILGSCHDRPWGALAIIDRRLGIDGREPVVQTWPADAANRVSIEGTGRWDAFVGIGRKFEDPWPLSLEGTDAGAGKYFLAARMTGRGEEMGICVADVFGNEMLIHEDAPGCFDPMPLGPRVAPPVIAPRRNYEDETGVFYVADVYEGTHMQGVERGAARTLRVIESPEKRFWTNPSWGGQGVHCPAMNWHDFSSKRILGDAPIEADGSAYVRVPAKKFVFFQLLDDRGMMIQSMRSGVILQPGERLGCVGCHESRLSAPPPATVSTPLAFRREPSELNGWHGEPRLFNFMEEVQPVFDRFCVTCHDFGKKGGEKLVLASDRGLTFNASYTDMYVKKVLTVVGAGPSQTQQPYSWGSHASPLIKMVLDGHGGGKIDAESMDRLITWVDLNAPYYPRYASAYPENLTGRAPISDKDVARLTELTGVPLAGLANHGRTLGPQVSFDRPEMSPCLKSLEPDSDAYREAVAIIRGGGKALAERPRADMPGFVPAPPDAAREAKYMARQAIEEHVQQAIHGGKSVVDPKPEASLSEDEEGA